MEVKTHSAEKLVLEDIPSLGRVISYALIGSGILLMIPSRYKPDPDNLQYIGIIILVIGALMLYYMRPAVKVLFDRKSGKMTFRRIRPIRGGKTYTYPLKEVKKIRIESKKLGNGEGPQRYRLALRLGADQWLPLTDKFYARDVHSLESVAKQIQGFLG